VLFVQVSLADAWLRQIAALLGVPDSAERSVFATGLRSQENLKPVN
jgi:hypothetical protein